MLRGNVICLRLKFIAWLLMLLMTMNIRTCRARVFKIYIVFWSDRSVKFWLTSSDFPTSRKKSTSSFLVVKYSMLNCKNARQLFFYLSSFSLLNSDYSSFSSSIDTELLSSKNPLYVNFSPPHRAIPSKQNQRLSLKSSDCIVFGGITFEKIRDFLQWQLEVIEGDVGQWIVEHEECLTLI